MPKKVVAAPAQRKNDVVPPSGTRIVEIDRKKSGALSSPVVICGFVGPGLAGLTAVGYVVDHLGLHEIAHVMSRHIPPSVVFIGGKIRHPFRVYRDDSGKLAVVICEVPIDHSGLYDVSSTLLSWLEKSSPREIVVLDGVPIRELPEERPTFYVAGEARQAELKSLGFVPAESVLIAGTAGSILSECLDRGVACIALLSQVSVTLIDPGAPLTLIRALNSAYKLNVTTKELEEDVATIHEELNAIAKQYEKVQEQAVVPQPAEGGVPKNMYG